jgi:hypothetical protein
MQKVEGSNPFSRFKGMRRTNTTIAPTARMTVTRMPLPCICRP